jgi:hypothetical protein
VWDIKWSREGYHGSETGIIDLQRTQERIGNPIFMGPGLREAAEVEFPMFEQFKEKGQQPGIYSNLGGFSIDTDLRSDLTPRSVRILDLLLLG